MPPTLPFGARALSTSHKAKFPKSSMVFVLSMLALALQWPVLSLLGFSHDLPWVPLLPGLAVFASAYLLSWSAEVAQLDMPPALALAILALVAVLPEYAVDMYFAWMAGKEMAVQQTSEYVHYAAANMTGANRLLIGLGWPLIVFVSAWKTKKDSVELPRRLETEVSILLVGTLYAFIIPIKGTLSWVDALVLGSLFVWYVTRILSGKVETPELEEGPAEMIASWGPFARRAVASVLFLSAGVGIFMAAEPFAEGLLTMGKSLGVDEYILVQWLAPLASEAPEFIVACLFAARGLASASFNTLLSSKLNQWTLLVGMLPLAYAVAYGGLSPMPLDAKQCEEIFLTAALSLLAVVVLLDFSFCKRDGIILFVLFATQASYPAFEGMLGIDAVTARYGFAYLYLLVTVVIFVTQSGKRASLVRLGRAFFKRHG